jgi:hypothetical protein
MPEEETTGDETTAQNETQQRFVARWGETIVESAGKQCKGGAYSYPGALDRYEKALGLKPAEAWLVKRLLTYDWDGKHYVWCSLRKISAEANASYNQVLALAKSLERKGYIRDMGQHASGTFSQVRDWSIAGLLRALEYAITCDPATAAGNEKAQSLGHPVSMADFWTYASGPKQGQPFEPFLPFTTPKQLNEYMQGQGKIAGWDPYYGSSVDIPQPVKREQTGHVCSMCGTTFWSGSRNSATRCPKCRKAARRRSLKPLIEQ